MSGDNPFLDAAAEGAAGDALRKATWERKVKEWEGHVAACEQIMLTGILVRMELASEAAVATGLDVKLTGIYRTETVTGVTHLRAKLVLEDGTDRTAQLEFIGSPKSMVIAAEAGSMRSGGGARSR
jgi:hypothetical protein